ncbi:unnamed protein product, partial [Polarella glacialis]
VGTVSRQGWFLMRSAAAFVAPEALETHLILRRPGTRRPQVLCGEIPWKRRQMRHHRWSAGACHTPCLQISSSGARRSERGSCGISRQ